MGTLDTAAAHKPTMHPTQQQVLDVFRAAAGPDGRAAVSDKELAAATGRPFRTVQYTVHTLVRDGHIELVGYLPGRRVRRVVRVVTPVQ